MFRRKRMHLYTAVHTFVGHLKHSSRADVEGWVVKNKQ